MRNFLYRFSTFLINIILIFTAFLTPLLFATLTTDYYDTPKLAFLVVATAVLILLWTLSWVAGGKVVITRTPLDIPLLALLAVVVLSTVFSTSKYSSIYGIAPDVHGSAISWVTYILLYFIAVSNIRKIGSLKMFLYAMLASGFVLSMVSILSFFNIFLPFEMARGVNFTPTGLTFSTVSYLLMLLPLAAFSIVSKNKFLPKIVAILISVLFSSAVVLTASPLMTGILFLVFAGSILVSGFSVSKNNLLYFAIPIATSALLTLFVYIQFSGNKIYELRKIFPQEVQLPLGISWKISASAFRDSPFLGTGPATYLYNFSNYKPVEFNQLSAWNFSFGSAYNEFLQILGTWGLLGLMVFGLFALVVFASARRFLVNNTKNLQALRQANDDTHVLTPALAISAVLAFVLMAIHASTLTFATTMFFILAAFMVSQKQIREKLSGFSIGIKFATYDNKQIDPVPMIVFIAAVVLSVPLSRAIYRTVSADHYHRLALNHADKDGTKTYEYLQKAETLNPYIDLYRVDLAQTNFALANALATQKGPTQENPDGTLTDADRQTIQTLVTQAINEGRTATTLSPRSSRNWEVLALIYRNITGVANNALTFALDAYGRAIQMDPMNPALRVNVGTVYYASKNYDLAIRFFSDAVNLKPDYVNGYYNLAIAYKDKGDLQNAQIVADQAVKLLQQGFSSPEYDQAPEQVKQLKIRDFNTASELLNQIRDQISTDSQSTQETALQNTDLPAIDVPELQNPPEAEVPPAVEENPEAVLPPAEGEDVETTPAGQ